MKANWIKKLFQPNWTIIATLQSDWKYSVTDDIYTVYGYVYYSANRNKYKYKIDGYRRKEDYNDMKSSCLKIILKKQNETT